MSEIIQKWLLDRLGVLFDLSPETFARQAASGRLIAELLRNYAIITYDQMDLVCPSNSPKIAHTNYTTYILVWLKDIGLNVPEDLIYDVTHAKGTAAIKLFYQLYLVLQDKDKAYFMAQQRKRQKVRPIDNRFTVTAVREDEVDLSGFPDHVLSAPLVENQGVIEWHKQKYQSLMERCAENREKYIKYIHDKFDTVYEEKYGAFKSLSKPFQVKSDPLPCHFDRKEYTYEELLEMQLKAQEIEKIKQDPKVVKRIVNKIKKKRRSEATEKELKSQMQKTLLMELWEELLSRQEKDFENTVTQKLLKQSLYEKQMATKMLEVRQQKQAILRNRKVIDDETAKKREEEFMEHFMTRQKSIGDQKYNYYFEKDRAMELHRRLYAEKMRLKAERHYAMCKGIAEDIVDISLRHAEYKEEYDEDVPRRVRTKWANLFMKSQPIFELVEPTEDIVQDLEDLPADMETIYSAEIRRQNAMDEKEFESYCNYEWPWELEDLLTDYEEDLANSVLGMNVLGHAVHRVLLTKYPEPARPPKPNLPKVKVAACVNGIIDLTVLPILQELLMHKGIRLIEMQHAINFCLKAYQDEIMMEYPETIFIDKSDEGLKNLKGKGKKEKTPNKGEKNKETGKKNIRDDSSVVLPKEADKTTQTPRIYPCEEIVLSRQAELGKMAFEVMNLGDPLNDNITVAMFIEYLKSLENLDGWALVNYPTTFEQAALLEEALTSVPVPGMGNRIKTAESIFDCAELLSRDTGIDLYQDVNRDRRVSKILPNLIIADDVVFYETYLTAYINMKQHLPDSNEMLNVIRPPSFSSEIMHDEVDGGEEEEVDPLDEFYTEQGCNYTLYYQKFDLPTIKHLGKLIIGDYTVPPRTSLELFGDKLLYIQAKIEEAEDASKSQKKGNKGEADKKEKKEKVKEEVKVAGVGDAKADKGNKKGKEAEVIIVREDKAVQVPEPEEEEEEDADEEEIKEEPPEPRAGEPLWRYSDVSIPEQMQIAIATLWENAENVYVMDFRELLFINRIIFDAVIPYVTYVKNHMRMFIARPDTKQTHLYDFQTMYNSIDADLRDDAELKAEVHCRINEFREKLWQICDHRMRESEDERQRIIHENWFVRQICELHNSFVVAFQLEIDRFVDSLQFIIDYFTGEITKMPSEEVLTKIVLQKIESGKELEPSKSLMVLIDVVENLLNVEEADADQTPFKDSINEKYRTVMELVDKYNTRCLDEVQSRRSLFEPKGAKKSPKPAKSTGGRSALPKFLEPEQEVKDYGVRIIEEFECAVQGEVARAKIRLELIKVMGHKNIMDVFRCAQKTFHGLFHEIEERYEREMKSVDDACEVLSRAVEAEVPVQPELVLDGDRFYIEPDVMLFPEPPIIPDLPIVELDREGVFTIDQLNTLVDILMDLAPEGSLPERAFVYLLQDIIVQDGEDGRPPMVPEAWTKLQPGQVEQLSLQIFGRVEFVDWKDFIVYNLSVPFPTERELMEVRSQFREDDPDITETVKDYQYSNVKFWFEAAFQEEDSKDMYRLRLIKRILLRMYRINEDTLNYTALLLVFCKDENPILGIAKAFEVSLGKYVCWDKTIGDEYIERVLYERFLHEQQLAQEALEHEENIEMAEDFLDDLIDHTVHVCDSVVIEDYFSESEFPSEQVPPAAPNSSTDLEFRDIKSPAEKTDGEDDVSDFGKLSTSTDRSSTSNSITIITEEKFSNVEIGFVATDSPSLAYFLPFELVLTIMTASLPWHSRVQNIEDLSFREHFVRIYNSVQNPEFNDAVFVHEFLHCEFFQEAIKGNFKFVVKDPPAIVTGYTTDDASSRPTV